MFPQKDKWEQGKYIYSHRGLNENRRRSIVPIGDYWNNENLSKKYYILVTNLMDRNICIAVILQFDEVNALCFFCFHKIIKRFFGYISACHAV